MILSTYLSDDAHARAEVKLYGINLRVVCYLNDVVVAVINTFHNVDDAEDFAEDFVLNKEKEQEYEYNGQPSVLHRIAEPNERDSQPCMA